MSKNVSISKFSKGIVNRDRGKRDKTVACHNRILNIACILFHTSNLKESKIKKIYVQSGTLREKQIVGSNECQRINVSISKC